MICRDYFVRFEGTAAQLREEGLVPEGFRWPKAAERTRWLVDGLDYSLRRARPDGHKGPMRSWFELDNWVLRIEVAGGWDGMSFARRDLERKAEELRIAHHRLTPTGRDEAHASWNRYLATCRDKAFQAFKAKVLALTPPPKRIRKAMDQAPQDQRAQ